MTIKKRQQRIGVLFASPFLIGFILFFTAPFIISIKYTFTFGTGGRRFVGLQNYIEVINSNAFQLASYNTFRFIIIAVPSIMILSLLFAILLQNKFSGGSFFRSVFLYPLVIPIASTVMVFQIFFAESGLLNTMLKSLHLPIIQWLDSNYAFVVLVGLYIWKNCGYNIVLLLAGLNSIPYDFYEAAQTEGASKWQQFRYITIPIMMPTFFFVFVISIINSFKCFREAFLIGGSLPHNSIYMLQHFMNNNFANVNYQRLSVAATLTFIVIFALVYVLFEMRKKAGDIQL